MTASTCYGIFTIRYHVLFCGIFKCTVSSTAPAAAATSLYIPTATVVDVLLYLFHHCHYWTFLCSFGRCSFVRNSLWDSSNSSSSPSLSSLFSSRPADFVSRTMSICVCEHILHCQIHGYSVHVLGHNVWHADIIPVTTNNRCNIVDG